MTSSPPDIETGAEPGGAEPAGAEPAGTDESIEVRHPLAGYADQVAAAVGGTAAIAFDTIKVTVAPDRWVHALSVARDDFDLVSFSFLSAIDWSNDPAVGDPLTAALPEESFEVLATVGDVTVGRWITFSTRLGRDNPALDSLVDVYAGANWHEREAHEMFGIDFVGHPNLSHLYLPESFIGNPLRKSFPLLSREVKPWPGKVDVEAMPGAGDDEPGTEESGSEEPGTGAAGEEGS